MPTQAAGATANSEAQVVVAKKVSDPTSDEDGLITYFRVRSRTALREGKVASPICARPGSQGQGWEIMSCYIKNAALAVDWASWRKGNFPDKPSPYLSSGIVLMHASIELDNLEFEATTDKYFISSGTYYYVWPQRNTMTVSHALPPYITLTDKSVLVPDAPTFLSGIIDAGWPNQRANSALNQ